MWARKVSGHEGAVSPGFPVPEVDKVPDGDEAAPRLGTDLVGDVREVVHHLHQSRLLHRGVPGREVLQSVVELLHQAGRGDLETALQGDNQCSG